MTLELVSALYRALAMAVGTGVLAALVAYGLQAGARTFISWVRYRHRRAVRAAHREDERRINGTANDFDPLARWVFDRSINFPKHRGPLMRSARTYREERNE